MRTVEASSPPATKYPALRSPSRSRQWSGPRTPPAMTSELVVRTELLPTWGRPKAILRFGRVHVSLHRPEAGVAWEWSAQHADGDEVVAIVIGRAPLLVSENGETSSTRSDGLVFLHPHREVNVTAVNSGAVMCVWVPWHVLEDHKIGLRSPSTIMASSALGRGLQAFLDSLLFTPAQRTTYTGFFVERCLTGMVSGVLMESISQTSGPSSPLIERARVLMMLRRTDRRFGVAQLAIEMNTSPRHLQRIFAAEGSKPGDELRQIRVKLASRFLVRSEYSALRISEVAKRAGFRNEAALRRAFRASGLPSPRVAPDPEAGAPRPVQ